MDDIRANPDEILKNIERSSKVTNRGHLKIFFGYAAGVGKTYAMLKAAHAAVKHGIDAVVGYVEPHQRPKTSALLMGLEVLEPLTIEYKGIKLKELNLDAVIKRKPKVIIVDELAHTNAEGCRHSKRYQDVEEILKAGIDVYTTVNVQHIESLNDMVASITGVTVRERIPDYVFDNADQVELVDIEPEELIERLKAGKIYKKEQAQKALGNFFDSKNLTALREIALRRCADRVNKISEKARLASNNDYYTDEHVLVCLSSSPTNPKIIRTAARMANAFKGSFTALFVETTSFKTMSEEDRNRLRSNIRLAEQLGATIETVYGDDVPLQIAEFARLSGVSKIVLGRSNARRKHFWDKPTLSERLTEASSSLDIYIIPDKVITHYRARKEKFKPQGVKGVLTDIFRSSIMLIAATLVGYVFEMLNFSEANIITVYILSVLITAIITTRRRYSLISSVLSVLTFNFCFTDPRFTFNAYESGYPATFIIMLIAAFITSSLAVKIKQSAKMSASTAYRTKILLETNQLLQKANDKAGIITYTANQLTKLLQKSIVFYPEENGELTNPLIFPLNPDSETQLLTGENEKAVAAWVFKNNKHAGATTNTLGSAKCLYLAVRVNDVVYGVVGIAMSVPLDSFEKNVVLSILGECALALENEKAIRDREQAAILAKNEQLRANLLRSISHDLRTPLTSISGNAGILLSNESSLSPEKKQQIYTNIYEDSLWLINLVENLLSVTRIEDGTMKLNMNAELMDEIVAEAVHHLRRRLEKYEVTINQSEEFIMAKIDARLIVQVIINIIDNAVKYAPEGSQISINTIKKGDLVIVEISDTGDGISDEAKPKIFDMFYTANTKIADGRRSLGLGLALCKSIITAHGGEISVVDNNPKGAIFKFTLPAEEVVLHE
ncbi:MAG: histidine kinase [Clostridiales bacterium]|nr:MAG: histidine kinase [Clostridiales bacterium]